MSKDEIKRLTPYQHVRLRTPMYFGATTPHTQKVLAHAGETSISLEEATWVPAVWTTFREVVDNSLDEVVAHGHGKSIDISYDEQTMTFSVADDGRGIPIDWDEQHQCHKATLALSELMSGRNFDNRTNTAGMNGIGASGVNFCSEWFQVLIVRDGQRFQQRFEEGNHIFGDALQIHQPRITKKAGKSGTTVSWKLSSQVFGNMLLPQSFVKDRIIELAAANPGVRFSFNDQPVRIKNIEQGLFGKHESFSIRAENHQAGFDSLFVMVPNFVDGGDHAHSMVNNIPTFNGGSHIDSFRKHFVSNLLTALQRENKRRNLVPNRSDVLEGLLIYNVTRMNRPDFDSQSKTRLINEEVDGWIRSAFDDERMVKKLVKDNSKWIDSIYERCAARTQKKDSADTAKLAKKLLRNKVPKLMDATGRDRSKCILALCEGDSALSMMGAVRDPEIHGGLPLRGKILNTRGESNKTILDNAILQDIMSSVGLILGQPADRSQLRYGQVWITCDADTDGANIMALLCNFFYLGWPNLFDPKDPPYFLVFSTPFIIQEDKKGHRHYWYADDVLNYDPAEWKGCAQATRAKGLGSLEEQDWVNSLAKPRLIPLVDDGKLEETLSRIFDKSKANERKEWMGV
jgi:DNA gyrase/topoisomerase IV subunit B